MGRDYTATLREGDQAPDFTLPIAGGGEMRLADELAASSVMLVFLRGTI